MASISGIVSSVILASVLALPAHAARVRNPMSVHVLDQQSGLPASGMEVTLERGEKGQFTRVASARTDNDGRIAELYPAGQPLQAGDYRVTFLTGPWYARMQQSTFYPQVQVIVHLDGALPHYHIPLLLSAYGYSTYRGS